MRIRIFRLYSSRGTVESISWNTFTVIWELHLPRRNQQNSSFLVDLMLWIRSPMRNCFWQVVNEGKRCKEIRVESVVTIICTAVAPAKVHSKRSMCERGLDRSILALSAREWKGQLINVKGNRCAEMCLSTNFWTRHSFASCLKHRFVLW